MKLTKHADTEKLSVMRISIQNKPKRQSIVNNYIILWTPEFCIFRSGAGEF